MLEEVKTVHAKNRKEWRAWLQKNHQKETRVALLNHKKHTGKPSLSHREAMEEAICFGWIDTTVKRIDEDIYARRFAKRTKKSSWSKATLGYAQQMIEEKKMAPYGLEMYKEGLKKKPIDHDLPKNPKTPKDLQDALAKNKTALAFFTNLAPSSKRYYIYWIERAKREETRKKRIKEVVICAKEKRKLGE